MERKDQALLRGEEEEVARIYSAADWGSGATKGGPTKNFAAETRKQAQFSLCAGASQPLLAHRDRIFPGPWLGCSSTAHGPSTCTFTRTSDLAVAGSP